MQAALPVVDQNVMMGNQAAVAAVDVNNLAAVDVNNLAPALPAGGKNGAGKAKGAKGWKADEGAVVMEDDILTV